jgi:tetratricopeptide (TPR) repeat protein
LFGRFDQSLAYLQQGRQLDPVLPETYNVIGVVYWLMRKPDESIAAFERMLELSPHLVAGRFRMARVLLADGQPERALEIVNEETGQIYRLAGLAMVHHDLGDSAASQAALDELIETAADVAAFQIAETYGHIGQPDKAIEWLNRAYENQDSGVATILGDLAFEELNDDPRWVELLQKLGLYEAWLEMPPEWGGPPR